MNTNFLPDGSPLSPEESVVASQKICPSFILWFLKTDIVITDMRVVATAPNTILGIIPAGIKNVSVPITQIASNEITRKYNFFTLVFGAILAFVGLIALVVAPGGLIYIVAGMLLILAGVKSQMVITNTGGGETALKAVPWQRADLQKMANILNLAVIEHRTQ